MSPSEVPETSVEPQQRVTERYWQSPWAILGLGMLVIAVSLWLFFPAVTSEDAITGAFAAFCLFPIGVLLTLLGLIVGLVKTWRRRASCTTK